MINRRIHKVVDAGFEIRASEPPTENSARTIRLVARASDPRVRLIAPPTSPFMTVYLHFQDNSGAPAELHFASQNESTQLSRVPRTPGFFGHDWLGPRQEQAAAQFSVWLRHEGLAHRTL